MLFSYFALGLPSYSESQGDENFYVNLRFLPNNVGRNLGEIWKVPYVLCELQMGYNTAL